MYKAAFDYLVTKFDHEIKPAVDVFKAAQLFLPNKINAQCLDSSSVHSLKDFSFYQDNTLFNHLTAELPLYLSSSVGLGEYVDPLEWLKYYFEQLPHLSAAASTVLVVKPSLAAAECIFIVKVMFWRSTRNHIPRLY